MHPNFFKKYDPKVVICLDGPLPYLLISRIKQKKYLSIFADARLANLAKRKLRILSNFKKNGFNKFDFVFTENEMAASQLMQNSLDEHKIKGIGLLQSSIAPLPFSENNSIFSILKSRPAAHDFFFHNPIYFTIYSSIHRCFFAKKWNFPHAYHWEGKARSF